MHGELAAPVTRKLRENSQLPATATLEPGDTVKAASVNGNLRET